jgi:Holliday junction resolvasome RuvABC endonuclease subunit
MKVLALDASSKTGWATFTDGEYVDSGALEQVKIIDFNVNNDPNLSPHYPYNIIDAAEEVAQSILKLVDLNDPNIVVIENTVRGRSRDTQRWLEFMHSAILRILRHRVPVKYMDPSAWRKIVEMRLSNDQKKNNRDVSAGKKRGRIGKKHLSVNMVNEKYNLGLKLKNNDQADAILLGLAYCLTHKESSDTQI